ncbi:MAG: SH3 domain-containing protein [Thermomicrobiales bacterium]
MTGLRLRSRLAFAAALLLAGVASMAEVSPVAAAFVNGDEVVVFDGALNLRQTAGTTGLILQVLPDGTPLTVTGDAQMADAMEWYPVVTEGAVNGFVAGQFIMLASGSGEFTAGDDVIVDDGPLNLRNAPGTASTILNTLPTGTTAIVLAGPTAANGMDWYQIQSGLDIGWVAGDFLALDDGGGAIGEFTAGDEIYVADGPLNLRNAAGSTATILKTLPTGTTGTVLAGPTTDTGYDWYQIQAGLDVGWVAGDFLDLDNGGPTGDFSAGSYVFVNVAKLNLRSLASTEGAVLQTMTDGTVALVISGPTSADGYEWYQISVDGEDGWAVGEYLVGGVTVGDNAIVADGPINLRLSADVTSAALAAVPEGATVSVTSGPTVGASYVWFGVTYDGQNGYIAGRFLADA